MQCKQARCANCSRYFSNLNQDHFAIDGYKTCKSKVIRNLSLSCKYCFKEHTNRECYYIYKRFKSLSCTRLIFCVNCQKHYGGKIHDCNKFFCKNCLTIHAKTFFCNSVFDDKFNNVTTFYFDCFIIDDKIISFSIKSLTNENDNDYAYVRHIYKKNLFKLSLKDIIKDVSCDQVSYDDINLKSLYDFFEKFQAKD